MTDFESSEKSKEPLTEMDDDDVSYNMSYSRNEILKILDSMNITFEKNTSTAKLNSTLKNKLPQDHPIHKYLQALDISKLKDIANKIRITFYYKHGKMCKTIANYFFKFHSDSPLTSLRKCMNAPACQEKIDKNHHVFQFLKDVPDAKVKEYTNRLGKKNLRNFNSMRSFLGHYFFDHDKNKPLESLQKFMKGELPELDVTLKKEATKRKSESRPGIYSKKPKSDLHSKKPKSDLDSVNENQENLKGKRKTFLDSISKKEGLGKCLIDNPILDKATKFRKIMSNWNLE